MKKILTISIFLFLALQAYGDVIYFPYQYSFVSYSAELIVSHEIATSEKWSTSFWGGIGIVGSFVHLDKPTSGIELALEKRYYLKPEKYNQFFISGYAGIAFMTDFDDIKDIGFVPGIKFNYKTQLFKNVVLEPYIGVSIPFSYSFYDSSMYVPFPLATIGVRLGLCYLKK